MDVRRIRRWARAGVAGMFALGALTDSPSVWAQEAPVPKPAIKQKVNDLVEEVVNAEIEVEVVKRRSKILRMKQDIFRVAVADPSVLDFVAFGSREIEIIGKETGSTTVTLWMGAEQQATVLSMLVSVVKDDAVDNQRRMEYSELADMINELFPNSRVQLFPIADKLIVRGQARDEQEAIQIMSIVRENAQATGMMGMGGMGQMIAGGTAAEPFPDASQLPSAKVINMLTIPGEKQVMLKVRIAELKRSGLRELGADFDFNVKDFFFSSLLGNAGNALLSGTFSEGSFNLVLKALARNGSAKILAEPNLVTLSGQPAQFLAGGQFPVPTVVGVGGAQAATTYFQGFGTSIMFTPTVLDKDRIRLQVTPTFSTINRENSVQGIFGMDTRMVATTVDLREGQVFAIAGLLQEQQNGSIVNVPYVGKIPGIGTLFRKSSISREETELIVVVSPELVHPLEPEQAPQILPGMEVTEPHDKDFYWYGDIEGRPDCHHRSTVWPLYKSRMKRCGYFDAETTYQSQQYYMSGPFGYSQ
uniref:Uncharacterized protein n=1 Tax=Schlesneria paludicola TaxID=360056 RepID=A0A7C4QQ77_9PLAN